jgi:hypothetical protein
MNTGGHLLLSRLFWAFSILHEKVVLLSTDYKQKWCQVSEYRQLTLKKQKTARTHPVFAAFPCLFCLQIAHRLQFAIFSVAYCSLPHFTIQAAALINMGAKTCYK